MTEYTPQLDLQTAFNALTFIRDHHVLVAIPAMGGQPNAIEVYPHDPASWQQAGHWIQQHQTDRWNIYFHPNDVRPGLAKKATKADMTVCDVAQADVDPTKGKPYAEARNDAWLTVQALQQSDIPPSAIFDSGNGFYPLWRLDQPVDVDTYDAANNGLNVSMGVRGTFNADRILKVPGTIAFSNQVKLDAGYPAATQARVVYMNGATMPVERFKSYATVQSGKKRSQATPDTAFDQVPLDPSLIAAVTALRAADSRFDQHMGTGNPDRSDALIGIARKLAMAGYTSNQFATVVAQLSKDAIDHVEDQKNYTRTLRRAWDVAFGERQAHAAVLPPVSAVQAVPAHPMPQGVTDAPWWDGVDAVDVMQPVLAPPIPDHCIPPVLRGLVDDHAASMGVPREIMFAGAMGACAGALDDRIQIEPVKGWKEQPRIWSAIIGSASIKKTPGLKLAMRPLRELEADQMQIDSARVAQFRIDEKKHAQDVKKYTEGKIEEQPHPVPPSHPETKRAIVQDPTVAKMSDILMHNQRGLLLYRDELSAWLASVENGQDRGAYLELYNGGGLTLDRVARGTVYVPNWSASIIGGIQPSALANAMRNVPEDGLLQRFYPFTANRAAKATNADVNPTHMQFYGAAIRHLWNAHTGTVSLMPEAAAILSKTWDDIFALIDGGTLSESMANHLSKWEGGLYRWVLVLHTLECAMCNVQPTRYLVSETSAQMAADLHMQYFLPNLFVLYDQVLGDNNDVRHVRWIAGHILAHPCEAIRTRDIGRAYRDWNKLDDNGKRRVLRYLEDAGWLKPDDMAFLSRNWHVNQNVFTQFADVAERERVRRAKIVAQIRK